MDRQRRSPPARHYHHRHESSRGAVSPPLPPPLPRSHRGRTPPDFDDRRRRHPHSRHPRSPSPPRHPGRPRSSSLPDEYRHHRRHGDGRSSAARKSPSVDEEIAERLAMGASQKEIFALQMERESARREQRRDGGTPSSRGGRQYGADRLSGGRFDPYRGSAEGSSRARSDATAGRWKHDLFSPDSQPPAANGDGRWRRGGGHFNRSSTGSGNDRPVRPLYRSMLGGEAAPVSAAPKTAAAAAAAVDEVEEEEEEEETDMQAELLGDE